MSLVRLGTLAYARSGDKGSDANIAVFARAETGYAHLRQHLTEGKVQTGFASLGVTDVKRYEVPNLHALNFVLTGVLGEGGSRSLRIDAQGKALGQAILEMQIEALTE
jgi:hypothetical protein